MVVFIHQARSRGRGGGILIMPYTDIEDREIKAGSSQPSPPGAPTGARLRPLKELVYENNVRRAESKYYAHQSILLYVAYQRAMEKAMKEYVNNAPVK